MKILLDTNILVHSHNKTSPYQKKASDIIRKAMRREIEAYISPQVLYEFFAVVTNPKKVEYPISSEEAAEICLDLWECREIEKINPTTRAPKEVFKIVKELNLSKGEVFDCVLAVTAKENDIEMIYTENVDDFKEYGFLKALNPLI
ncbi:type II toxin-antitoxin system VapC family toxin [Candidatus Bathyarchaeota archaeon]|nr:type II toxin-antitoxin system VapC family toxin [Candidatus Bathyarchaeota archaeon]MBS7614078.1 type II toxin-antitoxin system VapC family toxin [Candidatus Bathyarchaeota archaeon]MBS7617005.1 type II toxin-antitoxin system VapC family toxin [Candidatus Bathyarchaeota archaeon]